MKLHSLKMYLVLGGFILFSPVLAYALLEERLMFHPSHDLLEHPQLKAWKKDDKVIGYANIPNKKPKAVWLFLHGNSGQAQDRTYVLPKFSPTDAIYIMEYPGYGQREGKPGMDSFNSAAKAAYEELQKLYPDTPIGAVGESIGTGPASFLGSLPHPPKHIVLIVPFDILSDIVQDKIPLLPAKWLLSNNWKNSQALKNFTGEIDIFAAPADEILPFEFAKKLSEKLPKAKFHTIKGTHNEWSNSSKVKIEMRAPK